MQTKRERQDEPTGKGHNRGLTAGQHEAKPYTYDHATGHVKGNRVHPTNTTKLAKEKPEQILAASILLGSSRAIEFQEACGQQELVQSDVLPTDGIEEVRNTIESNGGKVGSRVDGDEIFTNVALPAGWKKKGTSHAMWSKLLDDKGRERASIFYKASFYDRSAHIRKTAQGTEELRG